MMNSSATGRFLPCGSVVCLIAALSLSDTRGLHYRGILEPSRPGRGDASVRC